MTEFRRDPLIRRWVVTGFAKSDRREDLIPDPDKNRQGPCPFCEGNEYLTPPENYAVRKAGSAANGPGWDIRVVPNRGTDLHIVELQKRAHGGVYDLQNASGIHETVVETPKHIVRFSELSVAQIAQVLRTFQLRYEEHKKNHLLKGLLIFRNHGRGAAGIFDHTHSQMVSLPFIPKAVADEVAGARHYYEMKTRCIFCDMISEETRIGQRVVLENAGYFAWCPFASRFPFEVWILPKRHQSEFLYADSGTFQDLARILKESLMRIEAVLGDSALSFVLHTAPLRLDVTEDGSYLGDVYHWHIELLPHAFPAGAFEWGGDFYLSPPTPEQCARLLNQAAIPDIE